MMSISKNIQSIQKMIRSITDRPVTVVAVTKGRRAEEIGEAVAAGITVIGENRWQEAKERTGATPSSVSKHFIGHLQTNKARPVVQTFDMIQSVDSFRLAQKISDECARIGKIMPVLIEVNTSEESSKSGVPFGEAIDLIKKIVPLKNVRVKGLMTMAIESEDEEEIRACFRQLRELSEKVKAEKITGAEMDTLSMGMSDDYPIAIEEGSTMVRIGRKIFDG